MIVRDFEHPAVKATTYPAHGGGLARMLLDKRTLADILFLAQAVLPPGQTIAAHQDPYEEIYFILAGGGQMMVDYETREVAPGQAVWVPKGAAHELHNDRDVECHFLVVAGPLDPEAEYRNL